MKDDAEDTNFGEIAMLTCCLHDLSKIRPKLQIKKPYNGG